MARERSGSAVACAGVSVFDDRAECSELVSMILDLARSLGYSDVNGLLSAPTGTEFAFPGLEFLSFSVSWSDSMTAYIDR